MKEAGLHIYPTKDFKLQTLKQIQGKVKGLKHGATSLTSNFFHLAKLGKSSSNSMRCVLHKAD